MVDLIVVLYTREDPALLSIADRMLLNVSHEITNCGLPQHVQERYVRYKQGKKERPKIEDHI